jgi:protein arginine N-methyltransferase 5
MPISVGLSVSTAPAINELAAESRANGFQFISSQLLKINSQLLLENTSASLNLSDLIVAEASGCLFHAEDSANLVAQVAPWVELDSRDAQVRRNSELLVTQQVQWASHLGIGLVQFVCPSVGPIVNFARIVAHCAESLAYAEILVGVSTDPKLKGWQSWNKIRMLVNRLIRLDITRSSSWHLNWAMVFRMSTK